MKLQTQIVLLVGTIITVALIHKGFTGRSHPSTQVLAEEKSESQASSQDSNQNLSQASKAATGISTAASPKPEVVSADQARQMAREAFQFLDQQSKKIFGMMSFVEAKERNFLLNQVGLSQVQYQEVRNHQIEVHNQLRDAEAWAKAFGVNPDEAKKPILENYTLWMETKLGVGYFAQYQEIALAQVQSSM